MNKRLVLDQTFPLPAERLVARLEEVLDEVDGFTFLRAESSSGRLIFQTGVTWTSWGQNMKAMVEPVDATSCRLRVFGQVRSTFLSSAWGERLHEQWCAAELRRALGTA